MKFYTSQKEKGFTLIEMVAYVAIVALILLGMVNMVLVIARSNKEFRVSRNIQNAATTAIERITRDIQDAEVVDVAQSTLSSHPGDLYLDVRDGVGTDKVIEFVLTNGRIHVFEDSVDLGPITPDDVEVTQLVFYVGSTGTGQMVRIEMTISSSIGNVTKTENFYATSVVRGTY